MPHIAINGVDLFYREYGNGNKTIVFSHGLLMDSSMWDFLLPHFDKHYRLICFDHRGQGNSAITKRGYDISELTEDAAALIKALCKEPVNYVGLSMGGMVGMTLAARHPDLVQSLVLLDTSAQAEPWHKKVKYCLMNIALRLFGVKPLVASTLKLMFGKTSLQDPQKAQMVAHWKQKIAALNTHILGPVMGVMMRPDNSKALANIHCPSLIIVGDEDRTTPLRYSQFLNRHIANSELVILSECGHSSALEKPEAVAASMQQFYLKGTSE